MGWPYQVDHRCKLPDVTRSIVELGFYHYKIKITEYQLVSFLYSTLQYHQIKEVE